MHEIGHGISGPEKVTVYNDDVVLRVVEGDGESDYWDSIARVRKEAFRAVSCGARVFLLNEDDLNRLQSATNNEFIGGDGYRRAKSLFWKMVSSLDEENHVK